MTEIQDGRPGSGVPLPSSAGELDELDGRLETCIEHACMALYAEDHFYDSDAHYAFLLLGFVVHGHAPAGTVDAWIDERLDVEIRELQTVGHDEARLWVLVDDLREMQRRVAEALHQHPGG